MVLFGVYHNFDLLLVAYAIFLLVALRHFTRSIRQPGGRSWCRALLDANVNGPTFWLLVDKERNPAYTDEFLVSNGAAPFSKIIMTPSVYLTDEAWKELVPSLIKGLRHIIRERA